jgi:DNA-binding response OmpR family regulator
VTTTGLPKPIALVGYNDEWMSRSIASIFEQKGFDVTRVDSGRDALRLARRQQYDVIMLDERIEELNAIEVCVALRDDPLFDHSTPIVLTSSAHATPQSRAAAYRAGAWEYCSQPLDVEALFLKLATFLRARQELAVAQSKCLLDAASGLYTEFGLHQLAAQLGARAQRRHEPFAALAFSAHPADREVKRPRAALADGPNLADRAAFSDVTSVFRDQSRKSDVVGHVGNARLAILAPDTDAAGAKLLVARLQRELDAVHASGKSGEVRLRAGYCAVADFAEANFDLMGLMERAESALDRAPAGDGSGAVAFEELPPS